MHARPHSTWRARLATAFLTAAMALAVLGAAPVSASTVTVCDPGSTSYSGRCYTNTTQVSAQKSTVVQSVVLQNWSSKTATMSCSFTSTITRSFSASVTLSASVKASLFGLVDASTSVAVQFSVSQSASSATTAAGSIVLKPGESVICQRMYFYVTQTIKETSYAGSWSSSRTYTVTAPKSMGVRIIDG